MEEILFSLKHYWRFVDCEALALKVLSWRVDEKAACTQAELNDRSSQDIAALKSGQEQHGKLLNEITANVGTLLEEHSAQRMDIRSLHTELHETREELKGEIRAAREEAKRDNMDLKATVVKKIQSLDRRTTNIEQHEGIDNPDKN
jgi:hypothetical protein